MRLQFLGCGDAFGSGGRLQTCLHVEAASTRFLVDCGASALIGFRRYAVDPNGVRTILISHLHGDHFGGLPFFLLDAHFGGRGEKPLTIAGPPTLERRFWLVAEALFPGTRDLNLSFPLTFRELAPEVRHDIDGLAVTAFEVVHPSGAPSYALRVEADGRTLAFSGDTEWTETLVEVARGADLLVTECTSRDRKVRGHLDLPTLAENLLRIGARRVIATHMGPAMLAATGDLPFERAEDGLIVELQGGARFSAGDRNPRLESD